jgi:hypothetical protein
MVWYAVSPWKGRMGPEKGFCKDEAGVDVDTETMKIDLETELAEVGGALSGALAPLVKEVAADAGPLVLARTLGVDKVLASRLLKALRVNDRMASLQQMPGPEPLRRVVRAAAKKVRDRGVVDRAEEAIGRFEALIRERFGDRSAMDAVLSAWVPQARREFELRRKQAVFRALSQLKGVQAGCVMGTVILTPAADGKHIDVVWLNGLFGLELVRPRVAVKVATRRLGAADGARRPTTLRGEPIERAEALLLAEFSSSPRPRVMGTQAGDVVHYLLEDGAFGSHGSVDVVFAEVNRGELARYVPRGSGRKGYFFMEAAPPARMMQFDAIVHQDLYGGESPELRIYDACYDGVASVNDASRDADLMDMLEAVEPMGMGLEGLRSAHVPRYAELVRHAFAALGLEGGRYRGYRSHIEYPVYGSQVTLAFRGVEARE